MRCLGVVSAVQSLISVCRHGDDAWHPAFDAGACEGAIGIAGGQP